MSPQRIASLEISLVLLFLGGWGRGLPASSLLIKYSDWKLDSFGMAGRLGEAGT